MAFCPKCGAELKDGAAFCSVCAAPVEESPQAQQTYGQPAQQYPPPVNNSAPQQQYGQPAHYAQPVGSGTPQQANAQDAQDNKAMAAIAYILFFVPLLTGAHKTSPFAKYHTNQGTILFISAAIYGVAFGILSFVLLFIPVIGWIIILILSIAWVIFPVFVILGIINAVQGKMSPLPLIGGFELIK
jgi:uncharacterized membrane protein